METTSMNLGYQPASFLEWEESEKNANKKALSAIFLRLGAAIECTTGAALTHRHAVGGVALISGLVLATGADTIPQALLTLAAFLVAGTCLHEKQGKGGEV